MFRSGVRRFLGATAALLLLLTFFFAQPQTASAFFASVSTYAELVTAINGANAAGGGVIAIEPDLSSDIQTTGAFPTITTDITILGNNASIVGGLVDPDNPAVNSYHRAFHITSTGKLTLTDVLFREFVTQGGDGGIIRNHGELSLSNVLFLTGHIDLSSPLKGGIIYNDGYAHIKDTTMVFNILFLLVNTDNGHELLGASIYNAGTMILENADITLNGTFAGNPASSATVYNAGNLTFNNVSLWANAFVEIDIDDPDIHAMLEAETVGGLHSTTGSQTTINNSLILLNLIQNCRFDAGATVSASHSYTLEPKEFFDLDEVDLSLYPIPDVDVDEVEVDDIDIHDIPDTACPYLIPVEDFNLGIGAINFLTPIPASDTIGGAGADATPYDRLGLVRDGAPDAGAYEYTEDEFGSPVTSIDYPFVYFTQPAATVAEDIGTAQIEIAVEFCSGCGVPFSGIFDIYILDEGTGTATSGADYLALPHFNTTTVTVDCTSGCPATVSLPVENIHDTVSPESPETIHFTIIGTSGFGWIDPFDQLTFELTIQDVAPYTASVSATQPTATIAPLANGQVTFDLGFVPSTDITLTYSVGGTANPDEGYTALSGSIIVPAGSQTAILNVAPLGDSSIESGQTVIVELTSSSYSGNLIDATSATVTIDRPELTATPEQTETPEPTGTVEPTATIEPTPDVDYPLVIDVLDAEGNSIEGMVYTFNVDELTIQFNIDVFDDEDGTDADSASNPDNYILLTEGDVAGFQTESCIDGVSDDDTQITFASVSYDSTTYVTTLTFDPALEDALYQLIVCGTTSIVSAEDTTLHLNNGVDAVVEFTIDTTQPITPEPTETAEPTGTAEPTVAPTGTPEPTAQPEQPTETAPTPAQPEDLGVSELPATGERPLWAELLGRWLRR